MDRFDPGDEYRLGWIVVIATFVSGCATIGGDAPTRLSHPMLSCAAATRAARGAIQRMGYTIADIRPASPGQPGEIVAASAAGQAAAVRVQVHCSDAGAEFEAISSEGGAAQLRFGRSFRSTLASELERNAEQSRQRDRGRERGLTILAEPVRPAEASSTLGVDLLSLGITALRIEIDNRSERRYSFDPAQVAMIRIEGDREEPLSDGVLRQKLGNQSFEPLGQQRLAGTEIGPGEKVSGYLYFRAATYRRVRLTVTDTASGESEGMSIEL
ncbi:MAG TPA: hypothetical protein VEB21_10065 [Terriglobales bacterium]|nr:hypothetical protein [Terriglobales bacterium]